MDFYFCDDDFYSSDDDFYSSDEEEEEQLEELVREDQLMDSTFFRPHKNYRILKEEDIKKLQEEDISDVMNALSVSRSVACTLLCQNNWTPSTVYENWFEIPVVLNSEKQVASDCNKCSMDTALSADDCGHRFCVDCWKNYISTSIKEDGPGCLGLKCPEPGCETHPGLDMVELVSSPDDIAKYYLFLCRLYVESSPKTRKWCPAPGCDFAIEFVGCPSEEGFDVMCDCGYKSCWNCGEESHSPLDCETVAKWIEKITSDAENTTWILAHTKPCPMCRRPIEKRQGKNQVMCSQPCGYIFCWLCLQRAGHPDGLCNSYTKWNRELAKEHLDRYMHYYERWDANDKLRKMALASLSTARNEQLGVLCETQKQGNFQLKFVVEAWEQIVECRRVLKWSYAYGYFRLSGSARGKMDLFEHLQGQAELSLERLHHCAEKEIDVFLKAGGPCDDFNEFRRKLVGLTSVTKMYFENFVRALENTLSQVEIVETLDNKKDGEEFVDNKKDEEETFNDEELVLKIADEEAHIAEDYYFNYKVHIADEEAHIADEEAHIAEDYYFNYKVHIADEEVHIADEEAHIADEEAHIAEETDRQC